VVAFGFREAYQLVTFEIEMQLARSSAKVGEVLHIPILLAPVGVGKTAIARLVAAELGYDLIKINCGECGDPTDIAGMPVPWRIKDAKGEEPYMQWVLNRSMHEACIRPVVLFFDDIDKSPALVEGALLSVFGERTARDRRLHPGTVVIAAGNRVEDDSLARMLSESMRTRGTIIHVEPRLADFEVYAAETPGAVHPAVLGFLRYRPAFLHKHEPDADRFPTPRGWVETSAGLNKHDAKARLGKKGPGLWKTVVALKCGEPVSNEFSAWHEICARINVKKLLIEGELDSEFSSEDAPIVPYAVAFAVSQELNTSGVKKTYNGFEKYLGSVSAEHRVALFMQLDKTARKRTAELLPDVASLLLSDVVRLEGEDAC
jgi:hypothetical protein